jgi:ribosomal protein L7/L12
MTLTPKRIRQIIKEEILAELDMQAAAPEQQMQQPQSPEEIRVGAPLEQQQEQGTLKQYEELAEQIIVLTLKSHSPAQVVPVVKQYLNEKGIGMIEAKALKSMVFGKLASTRTSVENVLDAMVRSNIIKEQ